MKEIKVKWGKNAYALSVDDSNTLLELKEQLYALTCVPVGKQKIMGLKSTASDDRAILSQLGVVAGKTLMLIGSAEGTTIPKAEAAEVENNSGGHRATSAISNGLRNIANTCYLNAAVQMLRSIPEIRQCLSQYTGSNPLLKELGKLLTFMEGTKEAVPPLNLWSSLVQLNPVFGERDENGMFMQQDSQEVVNFILQQIDTALTPSCASLFRGKVQQKIVCTEDPDDAGKITDIPFTMLTCNISGEVQMLEAGLEQAFNEKLNAANERLQREASYSKTSRISRLPEYVVVHMVRFSWKSDVQKKAKILKPITFPFTLDLFTLLTEDLKEEQKTCREAILKRRDEELERRRSTRGKPAPPINNAESVVDTVPAILGNGSGYYELCGVISHKGRSAESGHYIYWGKKGSQWLVFDDDHVAAVSEDDVKRLRGVGEAHIAYVLLYRSRDPISHRPVIPF
ncbi:unnamed protein product [Phytomonas sp. Hart1]|nr:unnamed protein product [Phytomonas sp. Hart1]|eukprot:CCW71638.1 unnamed protein product [Phytomonas sp. isolate Hart1]